MAAPPDQAAGRREPHRKIRWRLARSAFWIAAASGAANVLNAGFHFGMARILDPGDYSLLASLFAVILIPGVPMLAVQAVVARDVAARLAAADEAGAGVVMQESLRSLLRIVPPLLAVAVAVGVPIGYVLHVRQTLPLAGTAITLALTLVLPVLYGGLQGAQRFASLGSVQLVHVVLKVAFCLVLGLLGTGVSGVMFGLAGAAAAAVVLTALPLRGLFAQARGVELQPRGMLSRYSISSAVALTAFAMLTQLDVGVARAFFREDVAGAYAAATVTAKTLLIIATAVTTVLFPHVATMGNAEREARALRKASAAVLALGLLATGVLALFPATVVEVLFGAGYERASFWLAPLAVVMTLYAIGAVHLFHYLSLGRSGYAVVPAAVCVLQFAGYLAFHDRPRSIILVQAASAVVLVAASEVYGRRRPPAAKPA